MKCENESWVQFRELHRYQKPINSRIMRISRKCAHLLRPYSPPLTTPLTVTFALGWKKAALLLTTAFYFRLMFFAIVEMMLTIPMKSVMQPLT